MSEFKINKKMEENKEEVDAQIVKRLEEREKEIVSADLSLKNITADDFLRLIQHLKELKNEKNIEFNIKNFETDSKNPIIAQWEENNEENNQEGLMSITAIISIIAGVVVFGGIASGVLYFIKPASVQVQQESKCGNDICDDFEKMNSGVCPDDCKKEYDSISTSSSKSKSQKSTIKTDYNFKSTGKQSIEDTTTDINKDLESVDLGDLDKEFKDIDAELNNL